MIRKKLKNKYLRFKKNIKNYISSKNKAKNAPGLIRRNSESGKAIENIIINQSLTRVLDIGTWNGLGSTKMLIEILSETFDYYSFISIESDKIFHKKAKKNLNKLLNSQIQLYLGRLIDLDELPDSENIQGNA
jgi:predicted O-methyltransferase YrrM